MADTCPHCLTTIIKSDDPGEWSRESDGQWHDVYRCRDVLLTQRDEARAKVEEARKALDKYGEHRASCPIGPNNGYECLCGLGAALEKLRGQ